MGSNPAAPTNEINHLQINSNRCGGRWIPTGYHARSLSTTQARVGPRRPTDHAPRSPPLAPGYRRAQWPDRRRCPARPPVVATPLLSLLLDPDHPVRAADRVVGEPPPKPAGPGAMAAQRAVTFAAGASVARARFPSNRTPAQDFRWGIPHPQAFRRVRRSGTLDLPWFRGEVRAWDQGGAG